MSEIHLNPLPRNHIEVGNSRRSDWRSLRFMVYRDSSPLLTVGLIETNGYGLQRLDSRWAGFQVMWHPEEAIGDLKLYALTKALRGLSQT